MARVSAPVGRPVIVVPSEGPELAAAARSVPADYWPVRVYCAGEPDPGWITYFVPGELLDRFAAMLREPVPGTDMRVEFDESTVARALAEWKLYRERRQ